MLRTLCSRCSRSPFTSLVIPKPFSSTYSTMVVETESKASPPESTMNSTLKTSSPELEQLVEKIANLSLSQTAQLVSLIKKRLNLADVAMPMMAAGMPMAGQSDKAAEEAPKEEVKKLFNVTLAKFDATSKAKVIKEIKALIPNMNLIEAKKFVEGAPKLIKEGILKEEAEKLKSVLEAAGATVTLD